jgi:eukaryotic-like serine/threonine-protein kinase
MRYRCGVDHADLSGTVLDGRYRVIEPVAQGAMGVVYRAERIKLGRIVAVKVLHESLPSELSSRKRFELEAMAMAKLEHPHCAAVVDVGIHEDRPFVVMDFVSGQDLKGVIDAEAPLPVPRAVEILRQILSGLAHAHELGIIHRDIKPANLVLSQKTGLGDHIKVLDFGLARLSQDSSLTTGIVVGTPSYMAPEQIRGLQIDGRVDVYACGIVLFELLTGRKPFVSAKDDPIEVCSLHLRQPPPRLADVRPDLPLADLEPVVARALAKSPDDRYASAVEFAAALDAVLPRRASTTPVPGTAVTITPVAGTPVAGTPVAGAPVAGALVAGAPVAGTPVAGAPVADPRDTLEHAGVAPLGAPTRPSTPPPPVGRTLPLPELLPMASAGGPPPAGLTEMSAAHGAATVPGGAATVPGSAPPFAGDAAPLASGAAPPAGDAPTLPGVAAIPGRPPAAAAGPSPRAVRRIALIVGGALVALVVVIAVVAGRGGGSPTAASDGTGSGPPEQHVEINPADETFAQASDLIARGQRSAAIDLLVAGRKLYPNDARLPYLLGKLYFERLYYTDGLKMFRDAIRLDPSYRSDHELIKTVLRGFITTPRTEDALADFLREDIGAEAKPLLEETAADHPSSMIRARAASELRRYP